MAETYLPSKHKRRTQRRHTGSPPRRRLICNAVAVYASTIKAQRIIPFDTDSQMIGIDNRASGCFSHVSTDFVGPLRDTNKIVKGFGGITTSSVKIGTLKWSWLDDEGKEWTHYIPNSYYSPAGGVRLLSPQHFAQQTKDLTGTGTKTNGTHIILHWNKHQATLTVPLSPIDNVATFHMAPGFRQYALYCQTATMEQHELVNREEQLHALDLPPVPSVTLREWQQRIPNLHTQNPTMIKQHHDPPDSRLALEDQYYQMHCSLGHIHHDRMQLMVRNGTLPRRFLRCRLPMCASCLYGKATRKPWRSRSTNNNDESDRPTAPGQCISVDQLISPTPGFIAQMSGKLTTQRYTCATVFVDQYSSFSYVWVQRTTSVDDTLKGKHAFERYAAQHGITIKRYHADNGIFRARAWVDDCQKQRQSLSYAAVGAHHQNGVAERRIRVLQEMTRTQLIHAQERWPDAIAAFLWPYALRISNDEWNNAPSPRDRNHLSPLQRFTNTTIQRNVHHSVPFGCPTYVLETELQARLPFHKWKNRANVGIYLGKSPLHARNVALVMDRTSGRVSPQYHVKHDVNFDTVRQHPLPCQWMTQAGFVKLPPTPQRKTNPPEQPSTTVASVTPLTAEASIVDTINGSYDSTIVSALHTATDDSILDMADMDTPPPEDVLQAMKAQADNDTLYHHQAMKQPDSAKFREAMAKEIADQYANGNFELMKRSDVTPGATVLNAVWQMKRKRDLRTGAITKYKARLNIDGSRMVQGRDYDLTYAPVATWNAIWLILIMVLLHNWHTVQLDYVLAYPQAPITRELYMNIPKGVSVPHGESKDYVLKLKRNLYGQKQAARVWNQYLVAKLTSKEIGFTQSTHDECVFYKDGMIYALYTDDSIIAGPDKAKIDLTIRQIQAQLNITVEGDIRDFLGINIERKGDSYTMTQPQLIKKILKDLNLDQPNVKAKDIPMASSKILHRHQDSAKFDNSFNYRSVIGKLHFLEKATRPDLAYAAHQCARYSTDPRQEHGAAVRWIGRYLFGTIDKGMILTPDPTKGLEVHVDSDFVGSWDPADVHNSDTAKSRHGFVISFAGCPICWKSQLQPHTALSSSEAEYIGLSAALREAIPIIDFMDELQDIGMLCDKDI